MDCNQNIDAWKVRNGRKLVRQEEFNRCLKVISNDLETAVKEEETWNAGHRPDKSNT